MQTSKRRFRRSCAGALVTLAVSATAASAAPAPVRATVGAGGYSLVALSDSGRAAVARPAGARPVRLIPPASRVTLHLIDRNGVYAGPVVLAKRRGGAQVVLGVKAGAPLGRIVVRRGHAVLARPLAARWLVPSRTATARRGVPIGAGKLGRVRARSSGLAGPGLDQDRDGIPGAFDVDANGNLVLDNVERPTGPPSAGVKSSHEGEGAPPPSGPGSPAPERPPHFFSNLKLDLASAINASAPGFDPAGVAQVVAGGIGLAIGIPAGDEVELDCTGLSYCSPGGTGRVTVGASPLGGPRFPEAFDGDGDGFGTLTAGGFGDFHIAPNATPDEIGAGDTFIYRIRRGGSEIELPTMLHYIFVTTPALASWSSSVGGGEVSYPVPAMTPGTPDNPIPVGADGKLALTFWRPQRPALPGESGSWIDIGHLGYTADVPNGPSGPSPGRGPGNCDPSSYAPGPGLTAETERYGRLIDYADDRRASPANTLSFTVDLNRCLAVDGLSWNAGDSLRLDIAASSVYGDNAAQGLWVRRQ